MSKITMFLLFLALISMVAVRAEEEDADDMIVEDEDIDGGEDFEEDFEELWDGITLVPSDDIVTTVVFKDYPDKRLPLEKEIVMLVGVANNGEDYVNVSGISAALQSPYDLAYYIQNFTAKGVAEVLAPGAQVTLEYKFMADPRLEPLSYWFSAFVFINATDRVYRQVPINGTLDLTAEAQSFGIMDFLTYLVSTATICAVGYVVVLNLPQGKKRSGSKVRETRTKEQRAEDWDMAAYSQSKTTKVAGKRKGGAKATKGSKN